MRWINPDDEVKIKDCNLEYNTYYKSDYLNKRNTERNDSNYENGISLNFKGGV